MKELDFLNKRFSETKRLKKEEKSFLLANKAIEKLNDCRNAKEHYKSFIRKTQNK